MIFEVLEATTEARDRGERFDAYRTLDSLRESVLVSQHEPRIETFQRRDKAGWTLSFWTGRDAAARLSSVAIDTPLAEVYAGIAFDEAAS